MKKTGGEIIIDSLISYGIEIIFGIPGHGCLGIFDALRDRSGRGLVKYIQVKQEMCGVHMADGFYRASGKPLVMLTSIGAGAVNSLLGAATAYIDSIPVIIITGDAHTHMRGTGILQEFERQHDSDFLSSARPLTKRCWRVENAGRVQRIIKQAYNAAMSGRKGPVVISVPMDAQCDTANYSETPIGTFINDGPSATDEQISRAIALLGAAKRPVMLLGGGANYSVKDDRLARLAETLNAAVVTTMASKGVFPENHPLYAFHGGSKGTEVGNYITRSADLVLALGCRFADETTSSYRRGVTYNFPETKLIHVDIDASEIGKNYNPTLGIVADVNVFCAQILAACEKAGMPYENKAYLGDIKRVCDEWLEKVKRNALADRGKITISRLLYEMRSVLPPDAILVTSSGNTQAQMLQEYVFKTPGCCITTGGFSTMGWALPAALGVKLARPARLVVALCGDGDFLMTMQEMSTAVQYSIPVLIIVANNMGWMAIKDLQIAAYGEGYAFGNDFTLQDSKPYSPDYAAAARSFGIEAARVSKIEELNPVLKEAVECGASRLIEVLVDTQYPYSGGEATGWWDVPIPEYISDRRTVYMKEMGEEDI